MTKFEMFIVALAWPATVYQVLYVAMFHAVASYKGSVEVFKYWWIAMLGIMFLQFSAILLLLDANFN